MKKVTSILAIAVMALGMATTVIENTANEFDFMNDISKAIACGDCDAPLGERKPPKGIA
ncbi:MAG: hypothetical protein ABJI22_00475 [Maribacter sp.]